MSNDTQKDWLDKLTDRSHAVSLVRGVLGCGCPEEIFDNYQVQDRVCGSVPLVQLIMGNRLLVWIIDASKLTESEKTIPVLLENGLVEREARKLNRFRLVVVGKLPSSEFEQLAAHAESLDAKVHFHVLPVLDFNLTAS